MTVREFEEAVWETERIRIVVRADPTAELDDWPKDNRAISDWTIRKWVDQRLKPHLRGNGVRVFDTKGEEPHWVSKLKSIRP